VVQASGFEVARDSASVTRTRTREVRHLPPHCDLDGRVLRLIGKSRIAAKKRKQSRITPHDGVDVDESAWEAGSMLIVPTILGPAAPSTSSTRITFAVSDEML